MDESSQANSCWQWLKSTVLTKARERYNQMSESKKACVTWIIMVVLSPIALLEVLILAVPKGLQFIYKAALLFVIAFINTPFAVAFNISLLARNFTPKFIRNPDWSQIDPRANVEVELRLMVSDFFKVIADKLLVVLSTAVITFYTSPLLVFYTSMVVGVAAILLTWLNTSSKSKTAFSCLCDGYGLSPMTFFFSFIGLFDIGCHPIAKCSFVAKKAYLFTNDNDKLVGEEVPNLGNRIIKFEKWNAFARGFFQLSARIDFVHRRVVSEARETEISSRNDIESRSVASEPEETETSSLGARSKSKYIMKSFMVLKVLNRKCELCDYPVERLELPEDYPTAKVPALLNFLEILAKEDGFVTDKVRGRYEHSLTLLEITEGVQQYKGYKIVGPIVDDHFVVAGSSI